MRKHSQDASGVTGNHTNLTLRGAVTVAAPVAATGSRSIHVRGNGETCIRGAGLRAGQHRPHPKQDGENQDNKLPRRKLSHDA